MQTIDCPFCGRACQCTSDGLAWCEFCQRQFDDSPDEGGPIYNDPVKAAMHKEERAMLLNRASDQRRRIRARQNRNRRR